jgi:hypothetical protein
MSDKLNKEEKRQYFTNRLDVSKGAIINLDDEELEKANGAFLNSTMVAGAIGTLAVLKLTGFLPSSSGSNKPAK